MSIGNLNSRTANLVCAGFACLFLLSGCQKKDSSTDVSTRIAGPRGLLNGMTSVGGVSTTGVIGADASQQQAFQEAVNGFLSTDVRPEYVGYVSAVGQNGTGVRFGGRVALSTGSLRNLAMSGGYADISPNSTLVIQVFDFTPQYPNSPAIPPFVFSRAQGTISGNQAQIVFADPYGQVQMIGYLNMNSNTFEGEITYDNEVLYDGSRPGAAGNLGQFRIPLCSFFVCN